jgi:hypothetical protein
MGSDSPQRGPIVVIVMAVMAIAGAACLTYFMHVSSDELVGNLDSTSPDKVGDSLILLKDRRDPAGITKAKTLLNSDVADIWTNAALYLGAMGKAESIPYLVKALRTADPQDGHEISVDLTMMTGQDFGVKYEDWRAWWSGKNAGSSFDFDSHLGTEPSNQSE